MPRDFYSLIAVAALVYRSHAWLYPSAKPVRPTTRIPLGEISHENESSRRDLLKQAFVIVSSTMITTEPAHAVTRAVGGAEVECRAAGNCLVTREGSQRGWERAVEGELAKAGGQDGERSS